MCTFIYLNIYMLDICTYVIILFHIYFFNLRIFIYLNTFIINMIHLFYNHYKTCSKMQDSISYKYSFYIYIKNTQNDILISHVGV